MNVALVTFREQVSTTPSFSSRNRNAAPVVRVVRPQPGGLMRTMAQPCSVEAFDRADLFAVESAPGNSCLRASVTSTDASNGTQMCNTA